MKIKIKYKHGLYGGAIKLQVFGDKNLLTEIRQGEVKEVEISQDCGAVTKCESKYGNFTDKNTKKVSRYLVSSGKGERARQDLHDVYKR